MDVDFTIRQVDDLKDLRALRNFLYKYNLSYPNYDDWVDYVCIPEIEDSYKHAIISLHDGIIVGI